MKPILIFVLLFGFSGNAFAFVYQENGKQFHYQTHSGLNCGKWRPQRIENKKIVEATYAWFVAGFLSAFNAYVPGIKNVKDGLDFESIFLWYKANGKHIIIGWKGIPDDFYQWNYKAALSASKLTQYEVYVWAVRYHQKNWSPGEGGQICISTATRGRFGKTNCKK